MNVNARTRDANVELMFVFAAGPGRVVVRRKRSELQAGTQEVAISVAQPAAHRSTRVFQSPIHQLV
jgi:hypothetical protein